MGAPSEAAAGEIRLRHVSKSFERPGSPATEVLSDVDLGVKRGESLAIVGPSGSGKSTLLALMAGLDRPSSGEVVVAGADLTTLDESALARFRRRHLGLVFQAHHLLPQCSALENVLVPTLAGPAAERGPRARARALALLERVGLAQRADHRPGTLSGGECQRVALARALILGPSIVLADEPTGSLDAENAAQVGELLLELNRSEGTTLVVVTHSSALAARLGRACELRSGTLVERTPARPGERP